MRDHSYFFPYKAAAFFSAACGQFTAAHTTESKVPEDFHAMMSDTFPLPPLRESRALLCLAGFIIPHGRALWCVSALLLLLLLAMTIGVLAENYTLYNVSHQRQPPPPRTPRERVFQSGRTLCVYVCELTRRWDIFLHRRLLEGKGSHESAAQAKISDRNLVIGSPGSPRRNIFKYAVNACRCSPSSKQSSLCSFYAFNF
jgi:hypothetical protein